MNKKGYSLGGWIEGSILVILIAVVLSGVISSLNTDYGKSNQLGLGTNSSTDKFEGLQGSLKSQMEGGDAEFDASEGLTFKASWAMFKSVVDAVWSFVTGGWIEELVGYMHLPVAVGTTIRLLYFLSLILIAFYIFFKRRV